MYTGKTDLGLGQERFGQFGFLSSDSKRIFCLDLLLLFVLNKFFLLLQDLEFLLVASLFGVDLKFSFVELVGTG